MTNSLVLDRAHPSLPPATRVRNLTEATLVDRAVVQFLAAREGESIELLNCPRYIGGWITKERGL